MIKTLHDPTCTTTTTVHRLLMFKVTQDFYHQQYQTPQSPSSKECNALNRGTLGGGPGGGNPTPDTVLAAQLPKL